MTRGSRIGFDAKRYFHNRTGLGNYSRWLISQLSENLDFELHLYSPEKLDGTVEGLYTHFSGRKLRILQDKWRTRGIIKDLIQDGIKIYHGLSNELPFGIHKSHIKTVVTIHDLIQKRFPEHYNVLDRNIYNRKIRYAQMAADLIICPSEQTKTDLMSYFETPAEKIQVIPIGRSVIPSINSKDAESEDIYILCVSSFTERKNLDRLVRAFINSTIRDCKLVIAGGKGPVYNRLQRIAEDHSQIVLITNPEQAQLKQLYMKAKFTVFPSIFEGFGIPVLESFVHGKTAAVSKNSSIPEVGGTAVLYFDPESTDSIRETLENLWFSPKQRSHLESLIPEQLKQFNDQAILEQYKKVYISLL